MGFPTHSSVTIRETAERERPVVQPDGRGTSIRRDIEFFVWGNGLRLSPLMCEQSFEQASADRDRPQTRQQCHGAKRSKHISTRDGPHRISSSPLTMLECVARFPDSLLHRFAHTESRPACRSNTSPANSDSHTGSRSRNRCRWEPAILRNNEWL